MSARNSKILSVEDTGCGESSGSQLGTVPPSGHLETCRGGFGCFNDNRDSQCHRKPARLDHGSNHLRTVEAQRPWGRGMLLAFHVLETGVLNVPQWAGESHKKKNYPEKNMERNLV